jgi:hypothetical protein
MLISTPTLDETPVFAPSVTMPLKFEIEAGAIFPVLQLFGKLYPWLAGIPETVCDKDELDKATVPAVMLKFETRLEVVLFESDTPLLVAVAVALPLAVPLPIPKLPALPTPVEEPLLAVLVELLSDWAAATVGTATLTVSA